MAPRVLMLGWEFPPHKMGGLGMACRGLLHALRDHDMEVVFVLPYTQDVDSSMPFRFAHQLESDDAANKDTHSTFGHDQVECLQSNYTTSMMYVDAWHMQGMKNTTTLVSLPPAVTRLIKDMYAYAARIPTLVARESFDVIHAHDWITYPAGLAAKQVSGKPLIVHVHNTIFDRGLGNASPEERLIEQQGLEGADGIIAVSQYTKDMIVRQYAIPEKKIEVVHNGVSHVQSESLPQTLASLKTQGKKIVLFVGRITIQKGVEYFVRAAKRVLEYDDSVMFVIAGDGDQLRGIIDEVAYHGIGDNVIFTGWLSEEEAYAMHKAADVFVMPSVSEPFGLVPLEAALLDTPTIISRQSGAAEVMKNSLKVDFWDIDEMANKILCVLEHVPLAQALTHNGKQDAHTATWDKAAGQCSTYYNKVIHNVVSDSEES